MITLYLGAGSNIRIDGSRYLKGIGGLSWFPSETAKRNSKNYEASIFQLLSKLWGRFTSAQVLLEIYKYRPKTLAITPRDLDGKDDPSLQQLIGVPDPESLKCNAQAVPEDRARAIVKGQPAPALGKEPWEDRTLGSGQGCDVTVFFNPGMYADLGGPCPAGPGRSADELLFHELVHGMSTLRGRLATSMGGPAGYSNLEEFAAVLISNIYSSETQRPLRKDHDGYQLLKDPLTNDQTYFDTYKDYIDKVCVNHRELAVMLKKATGIAFNPFKFCAV
jgi:hypothetical protein